MNVMKKYFFGCGNLLEILISPVIEDYCIPFFTQGEE